MVKTKREALTVRRLIEDILVAQLSIPSKQIVNDTTFKKYTGIKRPDLLISEVEFDGENETQFVQNLVAYAEVKDNCSIDDADWKDAIKQGKEKSEKLKIPYFIVTNCKTSIFYNGYLGKEIILNGNPIREFQNIDILRLIKNGLQKTPEMLNIHTSVDSASTISEATFNKKLWELARIYRAINFENAVEKIDFTIGFIALEYFEEKSNIEKTKDESEIYWSDCNDEKSEVVIAKLVQYIQRLDSETDFRDFKKLMDVVRKLISSSNGQKSKIHKNYVVDIYNIIDSMKPLHGCGFDLFGAVYERFASKKEKKQFGEYFTRRPYAHIFAKLLLKDEKFFNKERQFTILDLACGTGGFLTECFKVLHNNYLQSDTLNKDAEKFISKTCFYGVDVREENISRTKLNMFLVGDGHTNMFRDDSLNPEKIWKYKEYDYIITNPPYGNGTIKAETSSISTVRTEIAFLCKIIKLLKLGGKACVITPDGVLENPTYKKFRKDLLEKCNIDYIVSLPKFAFAPYTKEKTYALFFTKRSKTITKIQKKPIWAYIIDNDGLANSDKRFPTKKRNNKTGWLHNEILSWVRTNGEEVVGKLEGRWGTFDDSLTKGTEWIDDKYIKRKLRKCGFLDISKIINDTYMTLMPEYWLRPYEAKNITLIEFEKRVKKLQTEVKKINEIKSDV